MNVGILSTGVCLGEHIQDNYELEKLVLYFDASKAKSNLNEWLITHFGIESRVKTERLPSELGRIACLNAINDCNVSIEEIDFLILNTTTGDYKQPTTATKVQSLLGMKKESFALEINMPCAGNIYGLSIAKSFIQSRLGSYGLVVGVDKMSTNIDQEDFVLAGMFGDAAAACVVGFNPRFQVCNQFLKSKDDEQSSLKMKASGSAFPLDKQAFEKKEHLLRMNGNVTLDFIEETTKEVFNRLKQQSGLSNNDVKQVIFHQASMPILKRVSEDLGLEENQVFYTLQEYGNTSSASVLLTFHDYLQTYKPRSGDNIFLIGMGAGLNWGGIQLKAC